MAKRMIRKYKIPLVIIFIFCILLIYLLVNIRTPNSRQKVMLIGIDAGEWDVINPLIKEGKLPNFQKMKVNGAYGYLFSPRSLSPVSWTEIATGKTKEKHGIYDFLIENKTRLVTSADIRSKTIWNFLNDNEISTGIYRYYITWPPEKVNGFMVSGLPQSTNDTFPPELQKELNFGNGTTEETTSQMIYLLKKYNVDFFVGVDYHIHFLEHVYWKYWKPNDFNISDSQKIEKYRNVLINSYQKMDDFLRELEKVVGKDAVIFIVSDHGMATQNPVEYDMDFTGLLEKLNLLNYSEETFSALPGSKIVQEDSNIVYPYFVNFLFLNDWTNKTEVIDTLLGIKYEGINESFFSSYMLEGDKVNFTINSKLLASRIEEDSTQINDFPLHVIPLSLPFGEKFELDVVEKSGEHPPPTNGIILVKGPMIKQDYEIENVSVYDITPTILYLYGLPIPRDMDGKVLTQIIKEDYLRNNPIKYSNESSQKLEKININETMQQAIEERLKRLGYVR